MYNIKNSDLSTFNKGYLEITNFYYSRIDEYHTYEEVMEECERVLELYTEEFKLKQKLKNIKKFKTLNTIIRIPIKTIKAVKLDDNDIPF